MGGLKIVLPERSQDEISSGLRHLTGALIDAINADGAYGLGGPNGYGVDYENDVFAMRRYYWGECDCGYEKAESEWCDTHSHSDDCYQTEMKRLLVARGGVMGPYGYVSRPDECSYDAWRAIEREIMDVLCKKHGRNPHFGAMVHCTCDHEPSWIAWSSDHKHRDTCAIMIPNFRHKATGFEVRWYKWIGRDMEFAGPQEVDFPAIMRECLESVPTHADGKA